MHCPYCRNSDSKVLDSRTTDDGGSIRRRRQCPSCERRFTTIEQMQLVVVKRSGVVEPFNRDKVINGVRKACKGRPVSEDQLARLGQLVEDSLRMRSEWRSWDRCASLTRLPTSASQACIASSGRWRISRRRSRCFASSRNRPGSSRSSPIGQPTTR